MNTASALNEIEVAVLQLMDEANSRESAPNEDIVQLRSKGSQNEAIPQTETENMSAIYRRAGVSGEEHTRLCREWYYGVNMPQKFMAICKKGGSRRAFAYRVLSNISKEVLRDQNGLERSYDITYFKETCYINYRVLWENIESFGRGLVELGISPNSRVAIYEETRWEWLATIYGIWSQNMVATTVYANLGEDALAYALRETGSRAIICNATNVPTLVRLVQSNRIPPLVIIYIGQLPPDTKSTHCRIISWLHVVDNGRLSDEPLRIPTDNDQVAFIMYTSGTTGDPKGVIHTHGSLISGVTACADYVNELIGPYEEGESYCAYLPLAHIFEFGVVNIFLARGSFVGFGNPRTLLDTYTRPHGDYREYKPVFTIGVPRVYDTIKKTVESQLAPRGTLQRRIFEHAFQTRLRALKKGEETPYWNRLIFSPFRSMLGGKMKTMLSAGGPLSAPTQTFLHVVFGIMPQGWGLTETVCVGTKQVAGDMEPAAAGKQERTCEMRLLDVEGYKHTDEPDPRGEILLRGPFLFKGYYKQEELTKEVLDEDGWFHTGDVGSIGPNGTLRIIGRVKALAKNVLGEYVAMEALESMYAHNSLSMPNGVCVLVHPDRPYICALVLTDEAKVVAFTREHGLKGKYPEVLQDPEFQKKATASFQETARASDRQKFEIVRHVRLLSDEWTPENGVLTAAGKLKRRVIDEKYTDTIVSLFVEEC
ncbi:fatty acyl CoA synthetase 2 [Trypanosoma brucei gambiense DAL972]|uniref:Fatty acyl CoA synthetase 2 n=3 Tax=Trypanosoma brucei TaxID=5691 RepID=Q38FB9_TRYB2|nr:fatty acyl CoA synthetase 2 [Trypanosoma brucei gambiense DAL972]XP_803724.1 fatty acyl CoA synthetase 2 [Trypanosoma brucei brucei TREU927]AAF19438.1 fatty acyl CoA synthetase 2 [Trypanosoma brucei]EAN76501.1 fatty acyl CoA synthetase 2 [Trypanosoma brucei brucei TREU927]CBH14145.1 fatty acyl CoA synthetase 2 [Trypanosoma brucei gambiense DAL972]|eukprot:XP_011776416.1 fatty acyl CoA synthetase 2 [Trypanosoma brucei gambiense DAL972]